ncbi:MAG: glycosyltransferase [Gammaproteobacteria bacterium]
MDLLPVVSIIIPVRNDSRLSLCLEALSNQSYPPELIEVIVINNGDALMVSAPGATVLHEPVPGSYRARNRGALAARGTVLAYTDADCIPDSLWVEAGIARLYEEDLPDIVGGDIRLFPQDPDRFTAAELFELVWNFPQRVFVEQKHFAATANLFVRREEFFSVGLFNDRLLSGGDVEWGQRAHRLGKRLVFSEKARVRHPARRSLGELVRKYLRTCGGHYDLRRLRGENHRATFIKLMRRPFIALRGGHDLETSQQRLRYAGVVALLSLVQLFELARLIFGGKPRIG